jgi:hypothetical protein
MLVVVDTDSDGHSRAAVTELRPKRPMPHVGKRMPADMIQIGRTWSQFEEREDRTLVLRQALDDKAELVRKKRAAVGHELQHRHKDLSAMASEAKEEGAAEPDANLRAVAQHHREEIRRKLKATQFECRQRQAVCELAPGVAFDMKSARDLSAFLWVTYIPQDAQPQRPPRREVEVLEMVEVGHWIAVYGLGTGFVEVHAMPDDDLMCLDSAGNFHLITRDFLLLRRLERCCTVPAVAFQSAETRVRYPPLRCFAVTTAHVFALDSSASLLLAFALDLTKHDHLGRVRSDRGLVALVDITSDEHSRLWALDGENHVVRLDCGKLLAAAKSAGAVSAETLCNEERVPWRFPYATMLCYVAGGVFVICQQRVEYNSWRVWGHFVTDLGADTGSQVTAVEFESLVLTGAPFASCTGRGSRLHLSGAKGVFVFDVFNPRVVSVFTHDGEQQVLVGPFSATDIDGQVYAATVKGIMRAHKIPDNKAGACSQQENECPNAIF